MNIFEEKLKEHVHGGVCGIEDLTKEEYRTLVGLYLSTIPYEDAKDMWNHLDKEKNYGYLLTTMLCGYLVQKPKGMVFPDNLRECYGAEDFGLQLIDDLEEYYFEDIEVHLENVRHEERSREEWEDNQLNLDSQERAKDMKEEGKSIFDED